MDVLLLGAGGREHVLAWKLSRSQKLGKLWCAPGSDAIAGLAACVELDILDGEAVASWCVEKGIGLVVIGPEAPLAAGVADVLRREGFLVFGPGKDAAQLESSKSFAKDFMRRHEIPTAGYEVFTNAGAAREALKKSRYPIVVKADGLAQGKGVRVCADQAEAEQAVADFMEAKSLGDAGGTVVLEEFLEGLELSVMAFMDSKTLRVLPLSRDHKPLLDGNRGPNTGGMGVFAPVPVDSDLLNLVLAEVFGRVVKGFRRDNLDYRGVLYAGLMLTAKGPKVLEFNCRFGDPEAQAVIPLVQTDLLDALLSCAQGDLANVSLETSSGACVCVILASEGYPGKPKTGRKIQGMEELAGWEDPLVFHSGSAKEGESWVTKGGRVLGVTAMGDDLAAARDKAYAAVSKIRFHGMQYRKDIAQGFGLKAGLKG